MRQSVRNRLASASRDGDTSTPSEAQRNGIPTRALFGDDLIVDAVVVVFAVDPQWIVASVRDAGIKTIRVQNIRGFQPAHRHPERREHVHLGDHAATEP